MRVVIQRAENASVSIDGKISGGISHGLVVLVGFTYGDTIEDIDYMVNKIVNLRIFDDEKGVMNKSVMDINGAVLSISQFTLYADCKKGRRPSYANALNGEEATKLYDLFNQKLNSLVHTETGIFGSDMQVNLTNDGPVTIIMESREMYDKK